MAVIPVAAMSIGYFPRGVKLTIDAMIVIESPMIRYCRRVRWIGLSVWRTPLISSAMLNRIRAYPGTATR